MLNKIKTRRALVGVVGLGYVGLPLALEVAKAGFRVTGVDLDKSKIKALRAGVSYICGVDHDELTSAVNSGRINFTSDYSSLADVDIIDVAVPTPLSKSKTPDVSCIIKAVKGIKTYFKPRKLVILESTTYPGTTRELVVNELSAAGFMPDEDFYAAFSPERVDPGNKTYGIKNTPKVVGGASSTSAELAAAFYECFIDRVVTVNSCEEAEMCKLLENTFRAINIGFINELTMMCDKMGINIWNVIEAAKTKPFGFMPFYPGPGIGGHCIPLDPVYLAWKAKQYGFYNRSIELASDINENMSAFTVDKLLRIMNKHKKLLNGARVLLLGMAYKSDVNDIRESPALTIYEKLKDIGADVGYYDPYIMSFRDSEGREIAGLKEMNPESLRDADVVIILTAHKVFDYNCILENARLIFDARNAFQGLAHDKIEYL